MTARQPQDTPPIVLLHALGVDASMWDESSRILQDRGLTVLTPDLRSPEPAPPDHTPPPHHNPPSLDILADDIAALLDRHRIDRAVVAGCSLGGYVAMNLLARHPERIHALALISTRARSDEPAEKAKREAFATMVTDADHAADLIAATSSKLVGATTRVERTAVFDRVRALAARTSPASLAWTQRAIAARPDYTRTLRAATIPALVVAGVEDELIAAADHQHLAEALPTARLAWIDNAGHLPPMETPDRVAAELTSLIAEAGSPTC